MDDTQSTIDVGPLPEPLPALTRKVVAETDGLEENYYRYELTDDGVSPMAIPGTRGVHYTSTGLEHNIQGTPSSKASDHYEQLDKRERKLTGFDYGERWADREGSGETAIITWGSCTGPVREALTLLAEQGISAKMISIRLLLPVQEDRMRRALTGVNRVLVVEQSHSKQFYHYVRGHYDLPAEKKCLAVPGPLPVYPSLVVDAVTNWSN